MEGGAAASPPSAGSASKGSRLQLNFERLKLDSSAAPVKAPEASGSPTKTPVMMTGLSPGDTVSVKYRGKEWRRATIVGVRPEGSFDVAYDNGEHENGVPLTMLRVRDSPKHMTASSPALDLTVNIEAAVTPRGSKSVDLQSLKSRQDLVSFIYRLQATIEEQAETIRLQDISIAALKRQTETIAAQPREQSLANVKIGTILFYQRVSGAEVERVEVIELFPPPPKELAFFMVRVVDSDRKGRIGVETQVTTNSTQASYHIEDFEDPVAGGGGGGAAARR